MKTVNTHLNIFMWNQMKTDLDNLEEYLSSIGVSLGDRQLKKDLAKFVAAEKRQAQIETLKGLGFSHNGYKFCAKYGKQFKDCAACVVDRRLTALKDQQ